jgi:hypothetical protein
MKDVHHWAVGHFSVKSTKHPLLINIHCACACHLFNPRQILTVGGEYTGIKEKLFHKKTRPLSMLQKCIRAG